MDADTYKELRRLITERGYGHEIEWAQNVKPPENSDQFFAEYLWVVLNSGMKNQVAQRIHDRILHAIDSGETIASAFHHPGKSAALDAVMNERDNYFLCYLAAYDKMLFIESMPWIGPITRFHLAKNLGCDCAKPDRHLVRIANKHGTTTVALCNRLAEVTGDRVATVDLVIWRAANLGLV